MQPIKPAGVIAAIDVLGMRAQQLADVELPVLFSGIVDRASGHALVQRALTDAEHATALLADGAFGTEPLQSARLAERMLEHASYDTIALRDLGGRVKTAVGQLRDAPAIRVAEADDLLVRAREHLDAAQLRRLDELVVAGDATRAGIPDTIADGPSLAELTAQAARDGVAPIELQRRSAQWYVSRLDEAERVAAATSIMRQHSQDLTPTQWHDLGALLDANVIGAGLPVPATAEPKLRTMILAGTTGEPVELAGQLHFEQFAMDTMTEAERTAEAGVLLQRGPDKLTQREWMRLGKLLLADTTGAIPMPRKVAGARDIQPHAAAIGMGTTAWAPAYQRYFDQYAVNVLPAEQRVAEARALLSRRATALSPADGQRLAALLDSDPSAALIDMPRSSRYLQDASTLFRSIEAKPKPKSDHVAGMQRYLDRFAVRQLTPEARTANANALLSRAPDTLVAEDWARLGALLDDDVDATLITLPRKLEGTTELATSANQIAKTNTLDPQVLRYFDAHAAMQMTSAERAEQVASLLQRDPATLGPKDWTRLASIVELDPQQQVVTIPKQIGRLDTFLRLARANAAAKEMLPQTQQYIQRWRIDQLPAAERAAVGNALLRRTPSELAPAEWAQLRAVLESDASGELVAAPRTITGLSSFADLAGSLANGGKPSPTILHYFERVAVSDLDEVARAAQADALLRRDPTTLTSDEWRRLGALVGDDADASRIAIPRTVGRVQLEPTIRELVTNPKNGESLRPHFERYLANALPADERTALAEGMLRRDMTTLTKADWSRLAGLVGADVDGAIKVPRSIDGLTDLESLLRSNAGRGTPNGPTRHYFERYLVDQLPAEERSAQATALLTRPSATLTKDEWARLGALLDADADASLIAVPRTLDNNAALRDLVRGHVAEGGAAPAVPVQRYFERFAVDRMTPAERTAQGNALLRVEPELRTKDDWLRLSTLLESDATGELIATPRTIDGLSPLNRIALSSVGNAKANLASAGHYHERVLVADLAPHARTAQAQALLAREPETLTPEEWRRLSALLDDDAAGELIKVPRGSTASPQLPFSKVARLYAAKEPRPDEARHYFQLAAVANMAPDVRLAEANQLLRVAPAELTKPQWARLAALAEHEPDEQLQALTSTIAAVTPFRDHARALSRKGSTPASAALSRYLHRVRALDLPMETRIDHVNALMSRPASGLANEDWTRLLGLLDSDPENAGLGVVRTIRNQSMEQLIPSVIGGSRDYLGALQRAFDVHTVGLMDPAVRTREARALLARKADTLTGEDASRLWALLESDPDGAVVGARRTVDGLKPLPELLYDASRGVRNAASVQYYLDVHALQNTPEDARAAEAAALFGSASTDLTREQWARLGTLLDSDVDGTAISVPRKIEQLTPISQLAREIANKTKKPDAATERYFTMWKDVNDPTYRGRLEDAIDELVAGNSSEASRAMVANEWWRMEQVVAGRPVHDQAAIAMVMMGSDAKASTREVKRTLEFAKTGLETATDVPTPLEPIRQQTLELLSRNISRIGGSTPTGAVRGYSNHPDYAEVGRIRANLVFLDHARNVAPPTPPPIANHAAAGAEEFAQAADGAAPVIDEKLVW